MQTPQRNKYTNKCLKHGWTPFHDVNGTTGYSRPVKNALFTVIQALLFMAFLMIAWSVASSDYVTTFLGL